jgi:hypothetical protein
VQPIHFHHSAQQIFSKTDALYQKWLKSPKTLKTLDSVPSRFGKGIDHRHAGMAKAFLVAADHGQTVNQRGCSQEVIKDGHGLRQAQPTPLVCHRLIHRQQPVLKFVNGSPIVWFVLVVSWTSVSDALGEVMAGSGWACIHWCR